MQVVFGLIVALMLVAGQSLWKYGVQHAKPFEENGLVHQIWHVAYNPLIAAGLFIYGLATLLFIYVIGKYNYGTTYALIVSFSLILASTTAAVFFHEKLNSANILGFIIILLGVLLVLKK